MIENVNEVVQSLSTDISKEQVDIDLRKISHPSVQELLGIAGIHVIQLTRRISHDVTTLLEQLLRHPLRKRARLLNDDNIIALNGSRTTACLAGKATTGRISIRITRRCSTLNDSTRSCLRCNLPRSADCQ